LTLKNSHINIENTKKRRIIMKSQKIKNAVFYVFLIAAIIVAILNLSIDIVGLVNKADAAGDQETESGVKASQKGQ